MLEGMTPPRSKAVFCKIKDTAEALEPDDSAIFMQAVDSPELWAANTLSKQLRQRGVSVADTTITKHRTKTCACYRELG